MAGAGSDAHARLETDHDAYLWPAVLMPVCFTFTNTGDDWLYFPDSAPWRIETPEGEIVWRAEVATTAIEPIAPGESDRDCWHGFTSGSTPAGAGAYEVVWAYVVPGAFEMHELRAPFEIVDPLVHPALPQ